MKILTLPSSAIYWLYLCPHKQPAEVKGQSVMFTFETAIFIFVNKGSINEPQVCLFTPAIRVCLKWPLVIESHFLTLYANNQVHLSKWVLNLFKAENMTMWQDEKCITVTIHKESISNLTLYNYVHIVLPTADILIKPSLGTEEEVPLFNCSFKWKCTALYTVHTFVCFIITLMFLNVL